MTRSRRGLLHALGTLVLVAALVAALRAWHGAAPRPVRWTMLAVSGPVEQADAHLIELAPGYFYLVDAAGVGNGIVPALRRHRVRAIEKLVVSHPHKDHYAGIREILAAGIPIREVRMNPPRREVCDGERPWGCDFEDVAKLLKQVRGAGIPVRPIAAGDVLYRRPGVALTALFAFDGIDTPVGPTDVNDTSVILRLEAHGRSALFTGDLNARLGGWLGWTKAREVSADVLKVPHHGTEGCAPDNFFAAVSPSIALVPAPQALWESDRSRRIRAFFEKRKVPVYVSGIHGDVTVTFGPERFTVTSGRESIAE